MSFTPTYTVTPRNFRQLATIDRTRGFLTAVRLRDNWISTVRNEIRVEDALASVQIEGSSLTLQRAFELVGTEDRESASDVSDSEREFLNYLRTFDAIDGYRGASDAVLSKGDLLNLHRSIVDGVRGSQRFAGRIRREDVAVGDLVDGEQTIHHQPPPWAMVEDELHGLLGWIEQGKEKGKGVRVTDSWVHPAIVAGVTQHRLVWIHPFLDGNGRTARMFTTLILYQRGYDFKYLFNLSEYYNSNRDKYYAALRTVDRTGDYTEWLEYFLGGLSLQMMRVESRAKEHAAGLDTNSRSGKGETDST